MLKKILLTICIIYLAFFVHAANTQTRIQTEQEKRISESYLKLQSPELHDRYLAAKYLSQFKKEELGREVMNEAIKVFFKEIEGRKKYNELAGKPKESYPKELLYMNSEEFMDYFAFLCQIVGKSRDEKILPLLVEYTLNTKVLLNFGESAIQLELNVLKTARDPVRRLGAVLVLRDILEDKKNEYNVSTETRSRIELALTDRAVSDKAHFVRASAVGGLGNSGDKNLIPILEKIAQSDQFHYETKAVAGIDKDVAPGTPITRYPVRIFALEALNKLKEGKKKE